MSRLVVGLVCLLSLMPVAAACQEALRLDASPVGMGIVYVDGRGHPWVESNGIAGLQCSYVYKDGRFYSPDTPVLP